MSKNISTIFCSLILGLFITPGAQAAPSSLKAGDDKPQRNKVIAFLKNNQELRKRYDSYFTGEFRQIPAELRAELKRAFPRYEFLIAKMVVKMDFPSRRHNLILVSNIATGEVVGYVWGSYWTLRPSASFKQILKGKQAQSAEEIADKIKTLARLLVHAIDTDLATNDAVGKVAVQKGAAKAELLRGEGVFRILKVEIDKSLRFGHLIIALPDEGGYLSSSAVFQN